MFPFNSDVPCPDTFITHALLACEGKKLIGLSAFEFDTLIQDGSGCGRRPLTPFMRCAFLPHCPALTSLFQVLSAFFMGKSLNSLSESLPFRRKMSLAAISLSLLPPPNTYT